MADGLWGSPEVRRVDDGGEATHAMEVRPRWKVRRWLQANRAIGPV